MSTEPLPPPRRTYVWWVILCLVGLDYFSSLAYLPSIAVGLLGDRGELAPFAGLGVVVLTLLAALPVYWYVVGRSPHGHGGVGLLERTFHGWRGKLLILVLLGFIATDFVITRTLSTSDAGIHVVQNDIYKEMTGHHENPELKLDRKVEPPPDNLKDRLLAYWDEPLILTLALTVATFAMYFFLVTTLSRGFVSFAVGVVVLYLVVNVTLIGGALYYLLGTDDGMVLVRAWQQTIQPEMGDIRARAGGPLLAALVLALLTFPAMAVGLSGFELSMASAPMIHSNDADPRRPVGRIFRARLLMLVAALIMCVLVVTSIFVVTLLVYQTLPDGKHGIPPEAFNRSLSYLAHDSQLAGGLRSPQVLPFAGKGFGFVYDLSTVLILCLAGASATISLKNIIPEFLNRFGMQMAWAHRFNITIHLFNGLILLVTVVFRAKVESQQWAYAASVLALLFGASLAATLDVRKRLAGSAWRWPASLPLLLVTLLFAAMGLSIIYHNPDGVAIAMSFVAVVLVTAMMSRYMRATEPRFDGFAFETPECEATWNRLRQKEFQILVPHDPSGDTLRHTEDEIRHRHRLPDSIPVIFIEVHLGDPSDFHQKPLMRLARDGNDQIMRVSRCTSISHVLAAIALEFRAVHPPELHFGWSDASPMTANINFFLFGQGNVPWMVRALIQRAEPDENRRPRIIVG